MPRLEAYTDVAKEMRAVMLFALRRVSRWAVLVLVTERFSSKATVLCEKAGGGAQEKRAARLSLSSKLEVESAPKMQKEPHPGQQKFQSTAGQIPTFSQTGFELDLQPVTVSMTNTYARV